MTKSNFLWLLFFLFSLLLKAQKINTISLTYGVNSGLLKDRNFSPLHYTEKGALFSLQYFRHNLNKKNIFEVGIDFSSGKIKTDIASFGASNFIYGKINASYYRKINIFKSNPCPFYTGISYTTNLYYFEWNDNEAFSYVATHGLTLNFKTHYTLNQRNPIYFTISVPFLQILARPPYNGRNEFIIENQNSPAKILFNGKITTFNNYFGLFGTIQYHFNINKRMDGTVHYNLNLQKVTGTNPLTHWQNQLQTGLHFKF